MTIKALPTKIDDFNVFRSENFNYPNTAVSLIEFDNSDQDQLFKYFDIKNKTRLRKLALKAKEA